MTHILPINWVPPEEMDACLARTESVGLKGLKGFPVFAAQYADGSVKFFPQFTPAEITLLFEAKK